MHLIYMHTGLSEVGWDPGVEWGGSILRKGLVMFFVHGAADLKISKPLQCISKALVSRNNSKLYQA